MSLPWVTIIPDIDLSSRYFLHISAIFFQSCEVMFSDSFMNGLSIIGLQILWSSGAISRIVSLSVGMAPPDFGSRREEMVPPVIMIATFGNFESVVGCRLLFVGFCCLCFSIILVFSISDSRIPML